MAPEQVRGTVGEWREGDSVRPSTAVSAESVRNVQCSASRAQASMWIADPTGIALAVPRCAFLPSLVRMKKKTVRTRPAQGASRPDIR